MNFNEVIIRGATYSGSWFHTAINYALIAVVVLPYLFPNQLNSGVRRTWVYPLVISIILQVAFWFTLGVQGVSIVWCVMTGFTAAVLFAQRRSERSANVRRNVRRTMIFSLAAAFAGTVFYAVSFPPITTIAHVSAVILGITLFAALRIVKSAAPREG